LVLLLLVALSMDTGIGTATTTVSAVRGGNVTFLSAGDVDSLDPGQTYYTFGYTVLYATNRTLYSYKPGSVNRVPDLATGPPQISKNDRTITVHIRSGIRYSPPLPNLAVTSEDIKYAIERAFTANVPDGYVFSYFKSIVGTPSAPGRYRPIRGIATPNKTTIIFHLKTPDAVSIAQALVMPVTVPVPRVTPSSMTNRLCRPTLSTLSLPARTWWRNMSLRLRLSSCATRAGERDRITGPRT
jgi:peptide/nickel transport system substrate-binding protein